MQVESQLTQVVAAKTDAQTQCSDRVRVKFHSLQEHEKEQNTAHKRI